MVDRETNSANDSNNSKYKKMTVNTRTEEEAGFERIYTEMILKR